MRACREDHKFICTSPIPEQKGRRSQKKVRCVNFDMISALPRQRWRHTATVFQQASSKSRCCGLLQAVGLEKDRSEAGRPGVRRLLREDFLSSTQHPEVERLQKQLAEAQHTPLPHQVMLISFRSPGIPWPTTLRAAGHDRLLACIISYPSASIHVAMRVFCSQFGTDG